jgi:ankyrin repeat protein
MIAGALAVLLAASAYSQTTDFLELVKTGTAQSIQAAIDMGADVNVPDKNGMTALMYAAQHNENPEVFDTLLSAGADPNAIGAEGRTPLALAAQFQGRPDAVAALLNAGADARTKDNAGKMAFDYAQKNEKLKDTDAYRQLRQRTWDLLVIVRDGTQQDVKTAINNGADIKAWDVNGADPLMYAARYSSSPEVITTLLKAGADVFHQDEYGATALMWAGAYNSNPETIITLLKAGADAKAKNKKGKTAFDYARENKAMKSTDALKKLEEASK